MRRFYNEPTFVSSFERIGEAEHGADAWLLAPQLRERARKEPALTVVAHLGCTDESAELYAGVWRKARVARDHRLIHWHGKHRNADKTRVGTGAREEPAREAGGGKRSGVVMGADPRLCHAFRNHVDDISARREQLTRSHPPLPAIAPSLCEVELLDARMVPLSMRHDPARHIVVPRCYSAPRTIRLR